MRTIEEDLFDACYATCSVCKHCVETEYGWGVCTACTHYKQSKEGVPYPVHRSCYTAYKEEHEDNGYCTKFERKKTFWEKLKGLFV